jgi:hypothetical protein
MWRAMSITTALLGLLVASAARADSPQDVGQLHHWSLRYHVRQLNHESNDGLARYALCGSLLYSVVLM